MSESRARILAGIRRGLGREALAADAQGRLRARLDAPPPHLVPARSRLPHWERVDLFERMALGAAATVVRLADAARVPASLAEVLAAEDLPRSVVVAPDASLAGLPWDRVPELAVVRRHAVDGDRVTVTPAYAGVAETGTLVLLSGPHSPTGMNFLPDLHVVVLRASAIAGAYEEVWARLRRRRGGLPRTVNMITGPSRSADIEQTIQLGAHGPIRLHILLVPA